MSRWSAIKRLSRCPQMWLGPVQSLQSKVLSIEVVIAPLAQSALCVHGVSSHTEIRSNLCQELPSSTVSVKTCRMRLSRHIDHL